MIQLLKEQSYHNKQGRTPSMGLMTYHVAFFYWFSSLLVMGERLVEWFHILRHVHQVLLFELWVDFFGNLMEHFLFSLLLVWSSHKGEEYLPFQWNLFPTNFALFLRPKELWIFLNFFGLSRLLFCFFFNPIFYVTKLEKKKKKPLKHYAKSCVYVLLASKVICFSFLGWWASLIGPTPPRPKKTYILTLFSK